MEEKYYGIEYVVEIWGDYPQKKVGYIYQFKNPTYRKFWINNAWNDRAWRKREIISADEVQNLEQGVFSFRGAKV